MPQAPLLADSMRFLIANRGPDGGWGSTYSTAWTLMALTELARNTRELQGNFSFDMTLNGTPTANGQATPGINAPSLTDIPISQLYLDSPNALRISRGAGEGRLYYTLGLQVSEPVEQAAPLQRGLAISRAYYPVECQLRACTPITSIQSGQKVKVKVSLALPRDMYHLRVEDYIPAGAEILDTRLKTSQQTQGIIFDQFGNSQPVERFDPRDPFAQGWGWWLFGEARLYDNRIAWTAEYLPAGTYELTYTLVILQPGEYRVLPAWAYQIYFPEVQGSSAGEVFTIIP
jgi:hypothetical protein